MPIKGAYGNSVLSLHSVLKILFLRSYAMCYSYCQLGYVFLNNEMILFKFWLYANTKKTNNHSSRVQDHQECMEHEYGAFRLFPSFSGSNLAVFHALGKIQEGLKQR